MNEINNVSATQAAVKIGNLPKILLIEDDALNANVIQKFLRKEYRVDVAFRGEEGVELAKTNEYCLILLDINLGRGMTGIEVLRELNSFPGFKKTPVIASTAYTMIGDKEHLLSEGFNDYISKPYTMGEILIKIRKNLQKLQ
jgi:two-component system, sensor histidine kinase